MTSTLCTVIFQEENTNVHFPYQRIQWPVFQLCFLKFISRSLKTLWKDMTTVQIASSWRRYAERGDSFRRFYRSLCCIRPNIYPLIGKTWLTALHIQLSNSLIKDRYAYVPHSTSTEIYKIPYQQMKTADVNCWNYCNLDRSFVKVLTIRTFHGNKRPQCR